MNRFEFTAAALSDGETVVVKHESVKIYDGHEKVSERLRKFSSNSSKFRGGISLRFMEKIN
jgi:hypothetical protein